MSEKVTSWYSDFFVDKTEYPSYSFDSGVGYDIFYILSGTKDIYTGTSEDMEYYRVMGAFYTQNQIVDALLDGLQRNGTVTIRTDYYLSDSRFNEIVQAVLNKGGYRDVYASMWLDVINVRLTSMG